MTIEVFNLQVLVKDLWNKRKKTNNVQSRQVQNVQYVVVNIGGVGEKN